MVNAINYYEGGNIIFTNFHRINTFYQMLAEQNIYPKL